jgi:hypothetical protein
MEITQGQKERNKINQYIATGVLNVELTGSQQERIKNIRTIQAGVSTIGFIGGIIYANRTGGGFWRYIGYSMLGSLITGVPANIVGTPFVNKILKESEQKQK